jgi:hypothetical protein
LNEPRDVPSLPTTPQEDFFEASFLSELQELANSAAALHATPGVSAALQETMQAFLAPPPGSTEPLTEEMFASLSGSDLADRTNNLVELCRKGHARRALPALENFIVFFQALVPTLPEHGAIEIKRYFFRLVPTLIHIAYNDFADEDGKREEGIAALRSLESVLIEISSVRLAPTESELVFRSIDQMAAFIGVGEYAMASELISSQLLSIIARNRLTRALYRLMEVEVSVQRYLQERLGYPTPQVRIPEDYTTLADYGPIRILGEAAPDGLTRRFIQVHLPEIAVLRNVVLRLVPPAGEGHDLRLDSLGSAELSVPAGTYTLGLIYQPD